MYYKGEFSPVVNFDLGELSPNWIFTQVIFHPNEFPPSEFSPSEFSPMWVYSEVKIHILSTYYTYVTNFLMIRTCTKSIKRTLDQYSLCNVLVDSYPTRTTQILVCSDLLIDSFIHLYSDLFFSTMYCFTWPSAFSMEMFFTVPNVLHYVLER